MKKNIPLFIFGNGLSMALSSDFSLNKITQKFINQLTGIERDFFVEICGGSDAVNYDDFEVNFSLIEDAYYPDLNYLDFIEWICKIYAIPFRHTIIQLESDIDKISQVTLGEKKLASVTRFVLDS